jgi:hypothetical protein
MLRFSLVAVLCSMMPAFASAGGPIAHPFNVEASRYFKPVVPTLDALIAQKSTSQINHVCVIGDDTGGGMLQAWVYWQEGDAIILWRPVKFGIANLALSPRYLDLAKDAVLSSDPALNGSTYVVSRRWARGVIRQCGVQGARVTIKLSVARRAFNLKALAS